MDLYKENTSKELVKIMQCKRDLSGKRIFSDEHAGIIENYLYNYCGKRECLPIDAICEIRDYLTQQLDEMSESMNKQNEEQKKEKQMSDEEYYSDMRITADAAHKFEKSRLIVSAVTGKMPDNSELLILLCARFMEKIHN
jgi:hypothetical protein